MALLQRINSSLGRPGPEPDALASLGLRSAGEDLRRQREAFKLELEAVEAALKIKTRFLAAIEEGRTDVLPGPAYAVGFVRAYSNYLGLDSAEILRRFKLEGSGLDAKPDLTFPVPLGERSVPGRGAVLGGLIAAICIYTVWYFWTTAERVVPERVVDVPAALLSHEHSVAKSPPPAAVSLLPAGPLAGAPPNQGKSAAAPDQDQSAAAVLTSTPPVAAARAMLEEPDAVVKTGAPPLPTPASGPGSAPPAASISGRGSAPSPAGPAGLAAAGSSGGATAAATPPSGAQASPPTNPPPATPDRAANPPPSSAEATAVNPPAPANPTEAFAAPGPQADQPSRVLGAADAPSRIIVRATADSWVQIRDAARTVLFTGVLKPGDTYRVPDRPGLVLRAGNAGGLDILIDGKPTPPLGRKGAVRNVELDPQALMSAEPVRD
jgi:cytoskeleton protein RodZ